jgi:hypothetical protein
MISQKFLRIVPGAICVVLPLAGCILNAGDKDDGDATGANTTGIDWTSYETAESYSIRVKNESNRDLVAFKGSIAAENLIGGVKKNEGDHGLPLNASLFTANTDFVLVFLTLEDYTAYKDNLKARNEVPFARVFAARYTVPGGNPSTGLWETAAYIDRGEARAVTPLEFHSIYPAWAGSRRFIGENRNEL